MLAADRPIFVVHGPTVIAFFSPLTKDDLKDGGNETLSDFRYYSGAARARLMDAGITLHEVYARSFRVRIGTSVTTFGFAKDQFGYYFFCSRQKAKSRLWNSDGFRGSRCELFWYCAEVSGCWAVS
jgi:hypothetical protein